MGYQQFISSTGEPPETNGNVESMNKYEKRCELISSNAQEKLKSRAQRRGAEFKQMLSFADSLITEQQTRGLDPTSNPKIARLRRVSQP